MKTQDKINALVSLVQEVVESEDDSGAVQFIAALDALGDAVAAAYRERLASTKKLATRARAEYGDALNEALEALEKIK